MSETTMKFDLKEIKLEIERTIIECSHRGLMHSTKWLAEMNIALKDVQVDSTDILTQYTKKILEDENADLYMLAKTYFDLKEYDRCAFYTEGSTAPRIRFLHFYSRYLSGERKKIHDMTDSTLPPDPMQNTTQRELAAELKKEYAAGTLDAYCIWLYGVVLKQLELLKEAQDVLVAAIAKEPLHWGAWLELAALVSDKGKASSLTLPNHWMKQFFLAHTHLENQLNESALEIYYLLQQNGFEKSTYITAQIAIAYHNRREVDAAILAFRNLHREDPYRLDNLDVYSNLLYVKEMRVELSHLAHHVCEVDKYRVETCCIIGNYYSLRSEHQKAVLYFQRALKLNPQYLSAWTLMGHEFMEMKNTNAAIQCYRQAIEINRRDYRAWYGLGQTYEILKMPFYCLYYYKQAQQLKVNDSRMLIALGETYEKLDKIQEALKCYYKARSVGDIEGIALLKMAKLYDKLQETEQASSAYAEYVQDNECRQAGDKSEVSQAYKYLANYYIKRNQVEEAYQYAQKCLDYEETREEGKALLKAVAQTRTQTEMAGGRSGSTTFRTQLSFHY